jgi:predicted transcriptional regulator
MANKLPKSFLCPTEFTLAVLGGKWKTVILCYLNQRPCRYSELRKFMPNVSDKVLTERLRDLKASELISHRKGVGDICAVGAKPITEKRAAHALPMGARARCRISRRGR